MTKVVTTELPSNSLLIERIQPSDFIDCFSVKSDLNPRDAANIITSSPRWGLFLNKEKPKRN